MQIQPYLFFDGRCEEALEFYRKALGAEVTMLMRYKESPDQSMVQPGTAEKIMHASFTVGGATVNASDGHCSGKTNFQGFSLALMLEEVDADRLFGALSEGGQVQMPMGPTFFAKKFGMLTDRFGVGWMLMVPMPGQH